jgi:hypothetical protein
MELLGDFVSSGFGLVFLWDGVYLSKCVELKEHLVAGDRFKKRRYEDEGLEQDVNA